MDSYTGTRGAFTAAGVTPSPEGEQAFTITADGARLANFKLSNYKVGVRQKSENSYTGKTGVTVENIEGTNFGRFWETVEGQETYDAVCRNNRIVGFERNFVRWFSVKGGLIEDCYAEGNQGGAYIGGVSLEGQCANVTIRRTEVRNLFDRTSTAPGYSQGDGFLVEGGQTGIVLEDLRVVGTADGGYDLKALDMDLRGTLYGEDNGRTFRFHRSPRADTATLVSKGARGRAIWCNGQTSQYPDAFAMTIGKVVAMDPNGALSIFRFESGPATVTVLAMDVYKGWRGKLLQENGGSGYGAAAFPNGCRVQQDDGSWITYPGAPPVGAGGVLL